ncbi:hypothetical protein [Marinibacterium profundimaris]|uniref:Uncharacterized protein n=1 Tax=Marinibacterium profundimaris TaxID=1679460 RepID=A0A225NS21_9RHOB|nr:hypothetical protein [Marinibacterium profundimaris]OWU75847.1 hypothetical protein ATO3_06580 [Marinibacterium profundimaris]
MELIADILLVAGALGAGFYCFVLARRLTKFNDLEKGVGGAVAVLSAQVDDLSKALNQAQSASGDSTEALADLTHRAEAVAQRLELMMASMHDVTEAAPPAPAPDAAAPAPAADPAPRAEEPVTRAPEGPMFMRHAADRKGAA